MNTAAKESKPHKKKPHKGPAYYLALKAELENLTGKRVAIFSHALPDPDAVGSMMGMSWLLNKLGVESDCFFVGPISHPQNVAMINLLDTGLKTIEEFDPQEYDFNILLDTVPSHAGVGNLDVEFDLVIDHHKEVCNGDFNGIFINLKAGSCCATIWDMIEKFGLKLHSGTEDNDEDSRVATAMMIGIATDTENMMSDDATEYEFRAWKNLFEFRNPIILKQIVNFERPKFWTDLKAESIMKAKVSEGVAVVGMGILPAKHRDVIADMSDEMVKWEAVHTAIAFAIVDGNRIEGSIRSSNASISVPQLCKDLVVRKKGSGGGKLGKGAYRYDLGGGGLDEDDDEDTKADTWELFNKKETKRIIRIMEK